MPGRSAARLGPDSNSDNAIAVVGCGRRVNRAGISAKRGQGTARLGPNLRFRRGGACSQEPSGDEERTG